MLITAWFRSGFYGGQSAFLEFQLTWGSCKHPQARFCSPRERLCRVKILLSLPNEVSKLTFCINIPLADFITGETKSKPSWPDFVLVPLQILRNTLQNSCPESFFGWELCVLVIKFWYLVNTHIQLLSLLPLDRHILSINLKHFANFCGNFFFFF